MDFVGGLIQWAVTIGLGVYFWRRYKAKKASEALACRDATGVVSIALKGPSRYETRTEGPVAVFVVTPARPPSFVFLMVLAVPFVAIAVFCLFDRDSRPVTLLPLAMAWLIFWFARRDYRPAEHRIRRSFRVSPEQIETNGKTFRVDDIHQFSIRDGLDQEFQPITVRHSTFYTNDLAIGAALNFASTAGASTVAGSYSAGSAHRAKMQEICYSFNLEAGGVAYLLAGGMSLDTANSLAFEVKKAIQPRT